MTKVYFLNKKNLFSRGIYCIIKKDRRGLMKRNGFISSALLYGLLALFLVVMIGTLAVLGNRKLAMDKIKENALIKIQTDYAKYCRLI